METRHVFLLPGPYVYFWDCNILSRLLTYPINSFFSLELRIYKIHIFDEAFFT